jgi:hypothetical protein
VAIRGSLRIASGRANGGQGVPPLFAPLNRTTDEPFFSALERAYHDRGSRRRQEMANLGIIIAISDYIHDAKNLPACSRDGSAIAEILHRSGRFDDIIRIDKETKSTQVKQRLTEFIRSHSNGNVEEIFFYFTGHGVFYDNEFYYLLTDYQQRRIRQTSLENTELDKLVRSLNPSLFVKIVDACHSGMTYIKSVLRISTNTSKTPIPSLTSCISCFRLSPINSLIKVMQSGTSLKAY